MRSIFSTKPLDDLLQEAASGPRLRRALGPIQITLLGIGAIIGAGIFATMGTAAAGDAHRLGAGPGLMLSFVVAGLVCACAAFCYAELASMVPIAGSAYTYTYATLGELLAWIIGWDLIIEYAVGNVAVAISWANYMRTFLAEAGLHLPDWLCIDYASAARLPGVLENAPHLLGVPIVGNFLAFGIVALISLVLVIGIRESAAANASMVVLKLLVLGFFAWVGSRYVRASNFEPFLPNGLSGVFAGAAVIFFAYIGFDAVSTVAEEAKNPRRDIPIGILASLAICTLIYVGVAFVFTGMMPFDTLRAALATEKAEPLALALRTVNLGGYSVFVVAAGSVVAHTAVLMVFQLGQPRIFLAMARDGLLPPAFGRVSRRFQTPAWATVATGLAVGGTALFTSLEEMVDLTNIGTLFAFALVGAGVLVLRRREPDRERPFRAPFGLFLPVGCILGCVSLIVYLPPTSWLRFAAWLDVGLCLYALYGSTRSHLTGVGQALDPARHQAGTSLCGAWLALVGTGAVLLAQLGDGLCAGAPAGWFLTPSAWLAAPLTLNLAVFCPGLALRAFKVRGLPEARRALGLVAAHAAVLVVVLWLVWA